MFVSAAFEFPSSAPAMASRFNRRELDRNDRDIGDGLGDLPQLFSGVEDLAADLVQESCSAEVKEYARDKGGR